MPRMAIISIAALLLMPPAASIAGEHLTTTRKVNAPPGFGQACARYAWLCSNSTKGKVANHSSIDLLKSVNSSVNRSIRPTADRVKNGRSEVWSLPTDGRGDCEDYALMKYKRLLEAGFPSENLALSVVLDRKINNHVVLVARTGSGDMVLDNLTNRIKPFRSTGYTFIARQNFGKKSEWRVSLSGPLAVKLGGGPSH
jgi:predicted transglutaminase-like cysteine proteinase